MYDVHLSGAVCLTGQLSGPTPAHPSIRSARRDAPDRTTRESRVESSRRKCEKKMFRNKSRSVPSPSDSAGEPPRLNLIRPAPSRDAFDRERVYGAGITGETRLVHPRVGVAESRFSFAKS